MAYLLRADEKTADGLQRIAAEQIERTIAAFSDNRLRREEAVHQARQRCKKIRALLQLFGDKHSEVTSLENASIRDAAAKLAQVRDADALLEAFDEFKQRKAETVSRRVFNEVHQVLTQRQLIACEETQVECRINGFIADMTAALDRASSWNLEFDSVSELMRGFARSHRRGRLAMQACGQSLSNEAYHDWRKWSKYQLYQTLVLRQFLKGSLKYRSVGLKRLGKFLGVDHDLAVLRHELVSAPDFSSVRELAHVGGLLQAIDRRRKQLQKRSLNLGRRVYTKGIKRRLRLSSGCP